MFKALRLARREYIASVRSKGFLVALIVAPVLMSGSVIAMALFKDKVDTTDKTLAVVDRSGVVADAILLAAEQYNGSEVTNEEGEKVRPAYVIEVIAPDDVDPLAQQLALSDRVRAKDLHAFVEVGADVVTPGEDGDGGVAYYAENAALDEMRRWLRWPINNELRRQRLRAAGVDPGSVPQLFSWTGIEGLGLFTADETGDVQAARKSSEGEAIGVPLIMVMLLFMMLLMGAIPLLNSVMEEKTQRIAEVLLGSMTPLEFMAGKVLGGLAISFTVSAVYVAAGLIAVRRMGVEEFVPYDILPWFFAFMSLAIVMMGSVFAALGAATNDPKDAQSLTMPAMLPMMIPMFVLVPVLENPLSGFATGMSLFPPFTPMLMLLRLASPQSLPAWQPWVGLAGVILTTLLAVWAGGRIFRVGILMQGQSPKLGEILRWVFRG